MVSVLQAKVKKLESEVGALKTQQKLDQGDFSSLTESTSKSGMQSLLEMRTSIDYFSTLQNVYSL